MSKKEEKKAEKEETIEELPLVLQRVLKQIKEEEG